MGSPQLSGPWFWLNGEKNIWCKSTRTGWFNVLDPVLRRLSSSWLTGPQLHGLWLCHFAQARHLLKLHRLWWPTSKSSRSTWPKTPWFPRLNNLWWKIPKAKESGDPEGTRAPRRVTRTKALTDMLPMARVIAGLMTLVLTGMELPIGNDQATLTDKGHIRTRGLGIELHRSRDSSGPQVPNTTLRYPTRMTVRLWNHYHLPLKCRVTRPSCYPFSMALVLDYGRCRLWLGHRFWLCPGR